MTERASRADDGVVIYRGSRQQALHEAVDALSAAGIRAVASWRDFHSHAYMPARVDPGEGEVVVPAVDAARARGVLQAWEAGTTARIREHLRDLSRQLRRLILVVGLGVLGVMALATDLWRTHPTAMWTFSVAFALLLLWEASDGLRAHRERAERARFSVDQPPRWFER